MDEHPLLPVVKACYEARLPAMGAGSGIVRIKMDVDTSGKPTAVSVEGTTDKAFAGCVEDGVRLLPMLKPPEAMHCERVVGYASSVQAFALVLDGKPLVDDVPIAGG